MVHPLGADKIPPVTRLFSAGPGEGLGTAAFDLLVGQGVDCLPA